MSAFTQQPEKEEQKNTERGNYQHHSYSVKKPGGRLRIQKRPKGQLQEHRSGSNNYPKSPQLVPYKATLRPLDHQKWWFCCRGVHKSQLWIFLHRFAPPSLYIHQGGPQSISSRLSSVKLTSQLVPYKVTWTPIDLEK